MKTEEGMAAAGHAAVACIAAGGLAYHKDRLFRAICWAGLVWHGVAALRHLLKKEEEEKKPEGEMGVVA